MLVGIALGLTLKFLSILAASIWHWVLMNITFKDFKKWIGTPVPFLLKFETPSMSMISPSGLKHFVCKAL